MWVHGESGSRRGPGRAHMEYSARSAFIVPNHQHFGCVALTLFHGPLPYNETLVTWDNETTAVVLCIMVYFKYWTVHIADGQNFTPLGKHAFFIWTS